MGETTTEVPKQYACPVCGKWGRRSFGIDHRGYSYAYYYCNPRARRGGKGCGERFRHLAPNSGCKRIQNHLIELKNKENRLPKMVALGFELVEFMKTNGIHDQFARNTLNRNLYRPFFAHKEGQNKCPCGCGLPPRELPNGRIDKFAHYSCANDFYAVSEMITNQGKGLLEFLVKLRGRKCECCKEEENYLEVDHIIEVVNGGGLCWIDNYQLLCSKCHKAKTARLAADRANERKQVKQAQTGQLSIFT